MKNDKQKMENVNRLDSLDNQMKKENETNSTDKINLEKELNELEALIKNALRDLDDEDYNQKEKTITDDELLKLEQMVKWALKELTELEAQFEEIFNPSSKSFGNQESNYLMVVRRFQNAMKVALYDGAGEKNIKTFEEGFNFYKNALSILNSTGNQAEIDQHKSELAQTLIQIVTNTESEDATEFMPFLYKACKNLAEIYDSFDQVKTGLKFHIQAGKLIRENQLLADFEYFQVILNHLILNDLENAVKSQSNLKLRHFKVMSEELIRGFKEKKSELINGIQEKIEVLCAQRSIETTNVIYLFSKVKSIFSEEKEEEVLESLEISKDVTPLSNEKIEDIKSSLSQGIQQLQQSHPNIQIPINAQIDTTALISEITQAISVEISREIKSLSDNLVSKILASIPRTTIASAPSRLRSSGTISDDDVPDIEIVEGGPQDRPSRPKLDDMIDSIIVSE